MKLFARMLFEIYTEPKGPTTRTPAMTLPEPTRPAAPETLLRLACATLDRKLRAGKPCGAEEFLTAEPLLAENAEWAVELIYTEFVVRQELGLSPESAEYYQRFPQWRKSLTEQFEIHELLAEHDPPAPVASMPEVCAGQVWAGRYEVVKELGRGGMGAVYQAKDLQLGRTVAIKTLLAGPQAKAMDLERWRREAETVAALAHPNIVQLYEVGSHEGRPFLVLEYVAGQTLADYAASRPMPAEEAAGLLLTIARAVQFAHERGIVHRDLKPSNVLLSGPPPSVTSFQRAAVKPRYEPKVTDFGLAKRFTGDSGHTHTGVMVGTPSYMAPEQTGVTRYIGPATDIYALGAVLYELLTGRPPFTSDSAIDTARQVVWEDPIPPQRLAHHIPRDLETVCLKCLEKDPYRRFATAEALAEDLHRYLTGQPILARPVSWWGRTVKWSKRRPAAAALVGVSLLAVSLLLIVGWWHAAVLADSNNQLLGALTDAKEQRARAEREQDEAKRQAKRYGEQLVRAQRGLFAQQLSQAETLWKDDPGRGLALLEDQELCPTPLRDFCWHYLHRLCQRQRTALRTSTPATCVKLSPAGNTLAVVDEQGVTLWNWSTTNEAEPIRLPTTSAALAIAWSADSQTLWTLTNNRHLIAWEVKTQTPRTMLPQTDILLKAACFSAHGQLAAWGDDRGKITLFDLSAGEVKRTFAAHAMSVQSVVISDDGLWLASSSQDKTCKLWNLAIENPAITLAEKNDDTLCCEFSPDSRLLATGGDDEKVKLWHVVDARLVTTLPGHLSGITSLAFSHDGQTLASGSRDRSIQWWNLSTLRSQLVLTGHNNAIHGLDFSGDGLLLASAGQDNTARLWNLTDPSPLQEFSAHAERILALAFSPDGRTLVTSSKDRTLSIWDFPTCRLRHRLEKTHRIRALSFTKDGSLILAASEDQSVKLIDPMTGVIKEKLTEDKTRLFGLALSQDERSLATAGDNLKVALWDFSTRKVRFSLDAHTENASTVAFSPDGRFLASAGADRVVLIWDVASGRLLHRLKGHEDWVHGLAFSPDGATLVTTSFDETIRMWNTGTWQLRRVLRGHTSYVMYVTFSPDGKTLATGAGDRWTAVQGEVKLWDADTGHLRLTLPQQTGPLAFHPQGLLLATGTEEGAVRLWPADNSNGIEIPKTLPVKD